jgi:hypothetical protein
MKHSERIRAHHRRATRSRSTCSVPSQLPPCPLRLRPLPPPERVLCVTVALPLVRPGPALINLERGAHARPVVKTFHDGSSVQSSKPLQCPDKTATVFFILRQPPCPGGARLPRTEMCSAKCHAVFLCLWTTGLFPRDPASISALALAQALGGHARAVPTGLLSHPRRRAGLDEDVAHALAARASGSSSATSDRSPTSCDWPAAGRRTLACPADRAVVSAPPISSHETAKEYKLEHTGHGRCREGWSSRDHDCA